MCSCSIKTGSKIDLKPGMVGISMDGVMNDNFASLLSWAWCINPEKVKAAIKSAAGLDISDDNLVTIVKAHQLGNDVKVFKVNFLKTIKGINFTQDEIDKSSCKVMLTR